MFHIPTYFEQSHVTGKGRGRYVTFVYYRLTVDSRLLVLMIS